MVEREAIMKSEMILRVKVISSQFIDDFERNVNRVVEELERLQRKVDHIDVVAKEGKLVAVIQYKEYLDEIDNLPDEIL